MPAHISHPLAGDQIGGAGSDFVIVEWTDTGTPEIDWIAPLHRHLSDDEAWYVLEGTLRFKLGNETLEATVGDAVLAPRGVPHAYGNARPGHRARYLLVMTPRIHALIDALHGPDADDPARVFAAHDSELLVGVSGSKSAARTKLGPSERCSALGVMPFDGGVRGWPGPAKRK